jgi:hypothetical protein
MIFIFIHSLKYINIFFNFIHEVRQKIFVCFTVRHEPKEFENHWVKALNRIARWGKLNNNAAVNNVITATKCVLIINST